MFELLNTKQENQVAKTTPTMRVSAFARGAGMRRAQIINPMVRWVISLVRRFRPHVVRQDTRSGISWNYHPPKWRLFGNRVHPRILRVSFSGRHGVGSDGNRDSHMMMEVLRKGTLRWKPDALIIDLCALEYVWGDTMLGILRFSCDGKIDNDASSTVVITSPSNRLPLESLLHWWFGRVPDQFLAPDLETARAMLLNKNLKSRA